MRYVENERAFTSKTIKIITGKGFMAVENVFTKIYNEITKTFSERHGGFKYGFMENFVRPI